MVGPLVQDGSLELLFVPADGVLADDGSALPDDELVNTVVDLRVNVVGAARQHNDAAAFPAGLRNDLGALVAQLLHVAGVLVVGRINGFVHGLPVQPREIMVQRLLEFLVEILAALEVEVIIDELRRLQLGAVALEHLGIVGHDGAVIMVVAQVLVQVVAHAGVEDRVHALLAQPVNVAVAQLGREAGRVAGDRRLTALVQLAVGEGADDDLKAEAAEQRVPERQKLVHIQAERDADLAAAVRGGCCLAVAVQQLELVGVEVQVLVVGLAGHGLVAPVAGDKALAIGKNVDGQLAVVAAPLTLHGVDLLAEMLQLQLGQHGAAGVRACLGLAVQGRAVSAHQARNVGTDDVDAHLLLKGAEHSLIVEGAALYHDVAAQLLGAGRADDLVQRVLDDGDGQTGADIFNRGTVLLRLLDRRVHEHGAAAAKVNGLVGKQAQRGKLLDVVAQRLGERLQKAAAAGGAGFVQEDVADRTVLNFEALHVLTADVDDEIHVGQKVLGGGKVRDSLDKTAVTVERIFDELLAVAGGGHAGDLQARVISVETEQRLPDERDRVAEVRTVALEQNVRVVVDDDELDGGGAGVDADMYRPAVCAKGQAGHGGL